ncbi:MAG: CbtB-domain containing protein [Prevotella sp.]|nr:CbtB-domain containing protein [Prevotella sp.]
MSVSYTLSLNWSLTIGYFFAVGLLFFLGFSSAGVAHNASCCFSHSA